jgi:hypothetical protein
MKAFCLQAFLAGVLFWLPMNAFGQGSRLVDENCRELANACPLPSDCFPPLTSLNEEDCNKCLVQNPFGGCSIRGNDPVCEARKAAGRAVAEADRSEKRAQCEAQNAASLQDCRKRMDLAIASCQHARSEASPYTTLLVAGGVGDAKKIPAAARDGLLHAYDPHLVDSIQVFQLSPNAQVPPEFKDWPFGFTVGDHVFLKKIGDIDAVPLNFWVRQLEMSRLYSDYGVKDLGDALTNDPRTIFGLVNGKVSKTCAVLSC